MERKKKLNVKIVISCFLMIFLLGITTIASSAYQVGTNLVPYRGNIQPNIVKVATNSGTYEYHFNDIVYGIRQYVFDTQTLSYSSNDRTAYYYSLDTDVLIEEYASYYVRFDRDYGVLGFIYVVDTGEFIRNIDAIDSINDGIEFTLKYRINYGEYIETDYSSEYIIGLQDFGLIAEFEDEYGITMREESRYNISVVREIEAQAFNGYCKFMFSGLGLYDEDLNPYDITIIDDNAYYNTETSRGYMSIYNSGVPTNTVTNVRATGHKLQEVSEGNIDYYQTYENIQTIWIYDNDHALPKLLDNKVTNMSLPDYTNTLSTNDYIKLTSTYKYKAQNIDSYFSNENNYNSIMELTDLRFDTPVDESAPYKTMLPWGYLDVNLRNFDLASFLDSTTRVLFVDVIGVFSIADIIGIVIAISLLFAFLKLYLGG